MEHLRRFPNRPRPDATEWEEALSAGVNQDNAYALWRQLWHSDAPTSWGDLLKETRTMGYEGTLTCPPNAIH